MLDNSNNNDQFLNSVLNSAFNGLTVAQDENTESVADLLDKYGLRWTVDKQPLILPTGEETGFFGIVRSDTKKTFATCKEGYEPFQNSQLAELVHRIADKTGYSIHKGGTFNGGGKVYLQLNSGNEIKDMGASRTTVKGFVTGINSHDGTTALRWGNTNVTIVCTNTFAAAYKALKQSARHTSSIHDKVEQSIAEITGIVRIEKSMFEKFIQLADVSVKPENIARIVKQVTDVEINPTTGRVIGEVSTYAKNRTNDLMGSLNTEMNRHGHTLWGLFSGVTHYTSHVLPVPKRQDARLESKYVGTGFSVDNEAFASVLQMGGLK